MSEWKIINNIYMYIYKQQKGTAIGTKIAPAYAMIFMDYLEEDILSNCLLKSLVWRGYIDDILMMRKHGEEEP